MYNKFLNYVQLLQKNSLNIYNFKEIAYNCIRKNERLSDSIARCLQVSKNHESMLLGD